MQGLEQVGEELPAIAKQAIEAWVCSGLKVDLSRDAPSAPVFVTLRNPDGSLRGCIGTLRPTETNVASETARSAVLAATRDPRFPPVTREELAGLSVEVSVLLPEERVSNPDALDPASYGVVVRDGRGRQGVLLPDVPGVDDVETQIRVAREKAGIEPHLPVALSRFEVRKFR